MPCPCAGLYAQRVAVEMPPPPQIPVKASGFTGLERSLPLPCIAWVLLYKDRRVGIFPARLFYSGRPLLRQPPQRRCLWQSSCAALR